MAQSDYAKMLADPHVDAVIVGVADAFHVPLAEQAKAAGKPARKSGPSSP